MGHIIFSENSRLNDALYGRTEAPIKAFLTKRGEQLEAESMLKNIFNIETSTHWAESYGGMTAMDGFKDVGENGEYPVTGYQEGYSKVIENHTWKNSFSISKEMIDDGRIIDMKKRPEAFIVSYDRTRETFGAAALGAAVRNQSKVAFHGREYDIKTADGSNLFATNHAPKVKGSSQSNWFADAFSADALAAAESAMQDFKDDDGNLLDVAPDTIIIPNQYALKKAVFEAIGSDKDPSTANNAFNYQYGRWNVIVWHYLNQYITAATSPWILLDSKANNTWHGLVLQEREPLTIKNRIDEDNDACIWSGRSRFGIGFVDWRCIALGGIASGTQLIST